MYPVSFVSLGPGEAELITLKGFKALQSADCIFYPSTITREGTESSRSLEILLELDIDRDKLEPFRIPMSKQRNLAIEAYDKASGNIKKEYDQRRKVAVVAEGDAGFYSSIHYIYVNLIQNGVTVSHIAGVPAFIACGSLAGIHIVKQDEQLNVIPGIVSGDELSHKLYSGDTVVIMKVSQCEDAVKYCIENITDATYHYFENVGVKDKEYYTQDVKEILDRKFPYFSLMIIRK